MRKKSLFVSKAKKLFYIWDIGVIMSSYLMVQINFLGVAYYGTTGKKLVILCKFLFPVGVNLYTTLVFHKFGQ